MKDSQVVTSTVISTLAAGVLGLGLLWVTFAPETVTRAEMQSYVEVTSVEQLRFLRVDIRMLSETLQDVRERVIRMESILSGRD